MEVKTMLGLILIISVVELFIIRKSKEELEYINYSKYLMLALLLLDIIYLIFSVLKFRLADIIIGIFLFIIFSARAKGFYQK